MKKWLTVAVLGLIAAPLTGCASSDLQIDYRGPFTLQVSACVLLATSADLRDDRSTPNAIWVDSLTVGQDVSAGGSQYTVDGVTHVSIGSEQPLISSSQTTGP